MTILAQLQTLAIASIRRLAIVDSPTLQGDTQVDGKDESKAPSTAEGGAGDRGAYTWIAGGGVSGSTGPETAV
jgi:hypothetical protein